MYSRNYTMILLSVIIVLIAVLLLKKSQLLIPVIVYGVVLLVSGMYYKTDRIFFWSGIVLTTPLAVLFYFQFLRRLFYLICYGGESANGMGSPLLFLVHFIYELPFTIIVSSLCWGFYKDHKSKLFYTLN